MDLTGGTGRTCSIPTDEQPAAHRCRAARCRWTPAEVGMLALQPRGDVFLDRLASCSPSAAFGCAAMQPTFTKPAPVDLRRESSPSATW